MTDSIASNESLLSINIGTENSIHYPNNIRFIGTINIDQTTEELSPRFIDRTNIIRIPVDQTDFVYETANFLEKINSLDFTFRDAIKLFNLRDFSNNNQIIEELEKESYKLVSEEYRRIKARFTDLRIVISPRIDNAFTEYFITAIKFMNQYKALDYFVAQRLITKIDGQGKAYGEVLILLKSDLENIFSGQRIESSESLKLLELIIQTGSCDEYYHTYNYFLVN